MSDASYQGNIELRSVIQTKRINRGSEQWLDGIGGHDIEAAKRVLADMRRLYPRDSFRLVQVIVEDTENPKVGP